MKVNLIVGELARHDVVIRVHTHTHTHSFIYSFTSILMQYRVNHHLTQEE